ncbi:MAG TPA: hypothetical protein VFM25_13800, partial [Verrucomicrobiae bacterium]|nr:hypothetical protein [Verrucomicrobiae bacterium]
MNGRFRIYNHQHAAMLISKPKNESPKHELRDIIPTMTTAFKLNYSVDCGLVWISGSTPAPGVPGRASRPAVARETATHVRTIHALDVF